MKKDEGKKTGSKTPEPVRHSKKQGENLVYLTSLLDPIISV